MVDALAPLEVEALEDELPVVWPLDVDSLEIVFVELEPLLLE